VGSGRYRSRVASELIDAAFSLYRRNLALILAAVALVQVPFALVRFTLAQAAGLPGLDTALTSALTSSQTYADLQSRSGVQAATAALSIVSAGVVTPLALAVVAAVVVRRYTGQPATLSDAWRTVAQRGWGLLLLVPLFAAIDAPLAISSVTVTTATGPNPTPAQTASAAGSAGILLVSMVFYVVALVPLLLAVPALIAEGVGGLGAVRRSWQLVRGAFWRTLGLYVLVSVIAGVFHAVTGLVLDIPGNFLSGAGATAIDSAAQAIAAVVATPIALITIALLYYDRRIRREAFDIEMLAASL
jgi:hypothetical protein